MKVDLKKKRALAAAILLSMSCYGQAWAEDSIITISADGKNLKMDARDTATYDPTIAGNSHHLKEHDGVYYFENDNGESFDSIVWDDKNSTVSGYYRSQFLDGNYNYTVLTKNLTINFDLEKAEELYGTGLHSITVARGKHINLGTKDNPINNIKMMGGLQCNNGMNDTDGASINIYADNFEAKNFRNGQSRLGDPIININAKKIHLSGDHITLSPMVQINQEEDYKKGILQIDGRVMLYTDMQGITDSYRNFTMSFYGKDSYLNGSLYNTTSFHVTNSYTFDDGAQWTMRSDEADSYVGNFNLLNSSVIVINSINNGSNFKKIIIRYFKDEFDNYYVDGGTFNADGGIIKMAFDGSKEINYGCPYVDTTNYNGDFIYINKEHIGDTSLILTNISEDTSKVIGRALVQVKNEQGTFNVKKTEGALSWTNYDLEAKKVQDYDDYIGPMGQGGNLGEWTRWIITGFSQESAPTTSVTTLLSTITAGYDTWRNDTDKFNERMGELRLNGAGNEGVWVRTKGSEFGRHSSNGSYTNKQQTYQLGYDAVTSKDDKQTTYTGVAAEYGKGSLSFDSGTGTMKSMGLGVYQTKMYESGHYLDLVGRFDKYKNDFHVADTQGNAINGKYGNNALSMSAEYGRKNELKHGWYIEPQSEVTLGYMFGNDFTTSNNIRVEQKNMPALIGRLGLNIGREVSDKVNFYVKASINHDFLGNYDIQMTDLKSGERLGASDRFGSSWFDYGAGLSVKTGKDSYVYFDIERAVGGEYKKNWDWNAGVRWSF